MPERALAGQRLLAVFVLGWLLFNQPFLGLFSQAELIFGIPALYVYLFAAWAVVVLLSALTVRREEREQTQDSLPATRE